MALPESVLLIHADPVEVHLPPDSLSFLLNFLQGLLCFELENNDNSSVPGFFPAVFFLGSLAYYTGIMFYLVFKSPL